MYKFIIICLQYWFFLGDVNLCRLQPIKIPKKERQLRFPHLNPFVVMGVLAGLATTGLKIIAPSKHVQDVMLKWSSFGIPPVRSFFGLQVVEPGCCLQAVLLLCAEEDATRNSQLQSWRRRRSSRSRTDLAYMASASRPGCVSEELRSIPQKNQPDTGKDQSFCRSKQVLKKKLKKNYFQVSSKLSLI